MKSNYGMTVNGNETRAQRRVPASTNFISHFTFVFITFVFSRTDLLFINSLSLNYNCVNQFWEKETRAVTPGRLGKEVWKPRIDH